MFLPKWLVGAGMALMLAMVCVLVTVAGLRAQHDLNADNTHLIDLSAVDGKGGEDITGPYEAVVGWPKPLHGTEWVTGGTAGVYVESPDRVYVAHRGETHTLYERSWGPQNIPKLIPALGDVSRKQGRWEHIICVYDRNGNLIENWEQWNSKLTGVQRIQVSPYDPEKHIWVTGVTGGEILKFTHDGKKIVMTLSEKDVPGDAPRRFGTEELFFMPNGDFYTDGGSYVTKFNKDGKFISQFGGPGNGKGQLAGSHGIQIDKAGRIYIADRENSRIEIFDSNGKYLDEWKHIVAPYCIRLSKDGTHLWVSDGYTQKFLKYDLNGKLLTSWGTFGVVPGAIWGPHWYTRDSEGTLYLAEDYNGRVQKFRPKKDANPAQIVDVDY